MGILRDMDQRDKGISRKERGREGRGKRVEEEESRGHSLIKR